MNVDEINDYKLPEWQEVHETAEEMNMNAVAEPDDIDFRLQVTQTRELTIADIKLS